MDSRGVGYGMYGDEHWLKYPIGGGWKLVYRLTYQGEGAQRRARIREVRVVTDLSGADSSFDPHRNGRGWNQWEELMRQNGRAFAPFSFEAVRRHLTARWFADALASLESLLEGDLADWGDPATRLEPPTRAPKVGRPGRPAAFYARFALRYERVEHRRRREPRDSTRDILAREYKKPITTIGKWIRTARQQGLLTPAHSRGGRGGIATEKARQIVAREGKK